MSDCSYTQQVVCDGMSDCSYIQQVLCVSTRLVPLTPCLLTQKWQTDGFSAASVWEELYSTGVFLHFKVGEIEVFY